VEPSRSRSSRLSMEGMRALMSGCQRRFSSMKIRSARSAEATLVTSAALFPFQKLVTDLSMTRPANIERDLDAFSAWWDGHGTEIFAPERYGIERDQAKVEDSTIDWERDTRTLVSGWQRFRIFDRDGHKCLACRRMPEMDGVTLHVDHKKPRSRGGRPGRTTSRPPERGAERSGSGCARAPSLMNHHRIADGDGE
jgi:hypothetical protein